MVPRARVAMSSPNGVTRFCSGTLRVARLARLLVHRLSGGGRIGSREGVLQPLLKLLAYLFFGQIAGYRIGVRLANHAHLHPSKMGARTRDINPFCAASALAALCRRAGCWRADR